MNDIKITADTYGKVVDKFLKENKVQMLITLPKGTLAPEIEDNISLGLAVQFFILLLALERIIKDVCKDLKISKKEEMLKGILALVYRDCLEAGDDE